MSSWDNGLYHLVYHYKYQEYGKTKEARCTPQPLAVYSGRGVSYTCKSCEEVTRGMEHSYSAKACPWYSACMEIFHSLISRLRIMDSSQAYRLVFEHIEVVLEAFHNTVRNRSPTNMKNNIWTSANERN